MTSGCKFHESDADLDIQQPICSKLIEKTFLMYKGKYQKFHYTWHPELKLN